MKGVDRTMEKTTKAVKNKANEKKTNVNASENKISEDKIIGKIIGISELNVKILLFENNVKINAILVYREGDEVRKFEVVQIDNNIASTVPFDRVIGLKKGGSVELQEGGLKIQYSDEILGKVFNPYGGLIDHSTIKKVQERNVYSRKLSFKESINKRFFQTKLQTKHIKNQKSKERGSIDVYHISLHNTPQHTTKDEQECQKDSITNSRIPDLLRFTAFILTQCKDY